MQMNLKPIFSDTKDADLATLLQDIYLDKGISTLMTSIGTLVTDFKNDTSEYQTKVKSYQNDQFRNMYIEASVANRSSKLAMINTKLTSYISQATKKYEDVLNKLHYERVNMEMVYRQHLYNGYDDSNLSKVTLRNAEPYRDLENRLIVLESAFKTLISFSLIANDTVTSDTDLGNTINHAISEFSLDRSLAHVATAYELSYKVSSPFDFKVAIPSYTSDVNAREYQYNSNTSDWLFKFVNRFTSRIEDFFVDMFKSTNYAISGECRMKKLICNVHNYYTSKDRLDSLDCSIVRDGRILTAYDIITSTIIPTFTADVANIANIFEDLGTNH